jgi:hypothetical protein
MVDKSHKCVHGVYIMISYNLPQAILGHYLNWNDIVHLDPLPTFHTLSPPPDSQPLLVTVLVSR